VIKIKIGIIRLGDISTKSYLPVLSEKEGIELVLCTRNVGTLNSLSKKYRIQEKVQTAEHSAPDERAVLLLREVLFGNC